MPAPASFQRIGVWRGYRDVELRQGVTLVKVLVAVLCLIGCLRIFAG